MGRPPRKCPMCGTRSGWIRIDASRGGFSIGKALVASALVGTPGLVAGAGGRGRETWACRECGFVHTYTR